MKALILRHAQSAGQKVDAALTRWGADQAEALVPVLMDLGAGPLYASPMRRARDPIAPYAAMSGQDVSVVEDLRERRVAPKDDANWRDHLRRCFDDVDYAAPGGESTTALRDRLAVALEPVEAGGGALPCVVSHGGAISSLFAACDPGFGFAEWQGLCNPDLFEVALSAGEITAFTRIALPSWEG